MERNIHFYKYDAENRLTDVYTTADSVTIEHEAHYDYYKHGPLARALIGQNQVQGLDYAYTLQGWLKAVNGSILDSTKDMGHDGDPATPERQYIGKDAYGFSLHYYEGDYYPINGTAFLTSLKAKLGSAYKGLYNGNISSMAVNVGILNAPKLYNYQYDQLNRLTGMDVFNGTNTGINLWTNGLTATNDYRERVSYDGNGNILTYTRNGYGGTQSMDNLTYHYNAGTNQLNYIHDAVPSGNYPNDLNSQNEDNYTYDAAGNLIKDDSAGITTPMTWSVYGKLLTIPSKSISYQYDAADNRIGKTVGSTNTWYVRDAQGNVLATYSGSEMVLQEQDLYGSSRLGMISTPNVLSNTAQYLDHLGSGTLFTFTRGKKLFELTNHLGNVLATISDKKFGTPVTGIPSQISFYTADIKSAQDYYPFGMEMPGRSYNANYPYSFNGKRDDKDAEYGWQDYGMREYDRMSVHFISPDPFTKKYPWYSPYQFAGGKPIWKIDLDGAEEDDPAEAREDREELFRRMERAELSRLLQSPTPEDRERQIKENEEFSKETPEQQTGRFRRLINALNNYGRNGFNAAERIFGAAPEQSTFNFRDANRVIEAQKLGFAPAQALVRIQTPYGSAEQELSKEAADVFKKVSEGATLYKIGTLGNSTAGEAQFWTTENPANYLNRPQEFASKFGIPEENLKSGQIFIESGKLNAGANFVTRPAPGVGSNNGGAIEVVTDPGNVKLETFNIIH